MSILAFPHDYLMSTAFHVRIGGLSPSPMGSALSILFFPNDYLMSAAFHARTEVWSHGRNWAYCEALKRIPPVKKLSGPAGTKENPDTIPIQRRLDHDNEQP
jgi:hypothetical protein